MRYRIDMSYDGSDFCGWQRQSTDSSVQETLEKALGAVLREETEVTGAGRTDTGVHASAYVAHFDSAAGIDCSLLRYKLNSMLPESIAIKSIAPAGEEFHARFDARYREYVYLLHRCKNPFLQKRSYFYPWPELDFDAMNRAAALLVGTHDFSCFEKGGSDNKTSVCTVTKAEWSPWTPPGAGNDGERQYWQFRIGADRFLRNMVRATVGTLLDVGRGRRRVEEFASLILPPDKEKRRDASLRSLAGESVPAHALYLDKVEY